MGNTMYEKIFILERKIINLNEAIKHYKNDKRYIKYIKCKIKLIKYKRKKKKLEKDGVI